MNRRALMVLLLLMAVAWPAAASPPTLVVLPIQTLPQAPARVKGLAADATTAARFAALASGRFEVVEGTAPPTLTAACVLDILCQRKITQGLDVDRFLTGVLVATQTGLKINLVLYDVRTLSARGSVEATFTAAELGKKVTSLVGQLAQSEPLPPPPPPPPPPAPRIAAAPAPAPQAAPNAPEVEERSDEEWVPPQRINTRARSPWRAYLGPDLGASRLAGYTLVTSGMELGWRRTPHLQLSAFLHQLNGYDLGLEELFFLVETGAAGEYLWGQGAIHPYTGLELRATVLAPTLTAVGAAARGGLQIDLTDTVTLRAQLTAGALREGRLPETVYELPATLALAQAQLQLRFELPQR